MGNYSPSGISNISVTNAGFRVKNPAITNTTLTFANTEVAIALPANTSRFSIRARGIAKLQLAYTLGQSGTTFHTILPGNIYQEERIDQASLTLYVQSNKASTVVELVTWIKA